jgi:hypothetical protein
MFLAGSVIGILALILYEVFPQYLFDINYSMYYFVIPTSVIASVMLVVPKLAQDNTKSAHTATNETDSLLNEIIGDSPQPQTTDETKEPEISNIGGLNAELDALLAGANTNVPNTSSDTITTEVAPVVSAGLDENTIRGLIDQKFEPVEKDLTTFKKDLNKIKEDMKITKESVDTLTESFEGTLTDMKAFQAEITNPLNFMRKYFEALDLSNLSDPSLPLKQGILQSPNVHSQPNFVSMPQQNPIPIVIQTGGNNVPQTPTPQPPIVKGSEMDSLVKGTDFNQMNSVMKPLFNGSLSVANMMAIIELVGEMFEEKGEDCTDLLVEQCKSIGLKPEDESAIYNIIDMLKNSGMSPDEAISQLYRFSKIMGVNDKEADAYYTRFNAQRKTRSD